MKQINLDQWSKNETSPYSHKNRVLDVFYLHGHYTPIRSNRSYFFRVAMKTPTHPDGHLLRSRHPLEKRLNEHTIINHKKDEWIIRDA